MGRHRRRSDSTSSSSSSSTEDSEPRPKRGATLAQSKRKAPTPSECDRISRLEKMVEELSRQKQESSGTVECMAEMAHCKKYESKISYQQKELLITFMENHSELAKGKLVGIEGRKTRNSAWEQLTTQLNHCEGANKTATKWQRVWIDLKNKIKKKGSELQRHRKRTGGGPASKINLSDMEHRILALLTDEAVYGLPELDNIPLDSEETSDVNATVPLSPAVSPIIRSPAPSTSMSEQFLIINETEDESRLSATDSEAASSHHQEVAATPGRRKARLPRKTPAQQAADRFAVIGEALNAKVDKVVHSLEALVEEQKRANSAMEALVEEKKQTNRLLQQLIQSTHQR